MSRVEDAASVVGASAAQPEAWARLAAVCNSPVTVFVLLSLFFGTITTPKRRLRGAARFDMYLTRQEKRAILSSWASDAAPWSQIVSSISAGRNARQFRRSR
jgi:hypothetical protein